MDDPLTLSFQHQRDRIHPESLRERENMAYFLLLLTSIKLQSSFVRFSSVALAARTFSSCLIQPLQRAASPTASSNAFCCVLNIMCSKWPSLSVSKIMQPVSQKLKTRMMLYDVECNPLKGSRAATSSKPMTLPLWLSALNAETPP